MLYSYQVIVYIFAFSLSVAHNVTLVSLVLVVMDLLHEQILSSSPRYEDLNPSYLVVKDAGSLPHFSGEEF